MRSQRRALSEHRSRHYAAGPEPDGHGFATILHLLLPHSHIMPHLQNQNQISTYDGSAGHRFMDSYDLGVQCINEDRSVRQTSRVPIFAKQLYTPLKTHVFNPPQIQLGEIQRKLQPSVTHRHPRFYIYQRSNLQRTPRINGRPGSSASSAHFQFSVTWNRLELSPGPR
jgi:hypothetical protein